MLFLSFPIAFAILTSALDAPPGHVLHERSDRVPTRWMKRDRIDPEALLSVRIGLTQRNLENGHDYLMNVYVLDEHSDYIAILFIAKSTQITSRLAKLRKALDPEASH